MQLVFESKLESNMSSSNFYHNINTIEDVNILNITENNHIDKNVNEEINENKTILNSSPFSNNINDEQNQNGCDETGNKTELKNDELEYCILKEKVDTVVIEENLVENKIVNTESHQMVIDVDSHENSLNEINENIPQLNNSENIDEKFEVSVKNIEDHLVENNELELHLSNCDENEFKNETMGGKLNDENLEIAVSKGSIIDDENIKSDLTHSDKENTTLNENSFENESIIVEESSSDVSQNKLEILKENESITVKESSPDVSQNKLEILKENETITVEESSDVSQNKVEISKENENECSQIIDTVDIMSDDERETQKDNLILDVEVTDKNKSESIVLEMEDDLYISENDQNKSNKDKDIDNKNMDTLNAIDTVNTNGTSTTSIILDDDDDFINKMNLNVTENENEKKEKNYDSNPSSPITSQVENENNQEELHISDDKKEEIKNNSVISLDFMKTFKSNFGKMTREELEEFCLVKIVEAIIRKSNLSEAEIRLKSQAKSIDTLRKTLSVVTKQNRDLEIVMKNLTNEHKKRKHEIIEPVKISRSVGFQVGASSFRSKHSKGQSPSSTPTHLNQAKQTKPSKLTQQPVVVTPGNTTYSPMVPITGTENKPSVNNNNNISSQQVSTINTNASTSNNKKKIPVPIHSSVSNKVDIKSGKVNSSNPVLKNIPSSKSPVEKRSLDQSIDLTDDEPPAKQLALSNNRSKVVSTAKIQNSVHQKKSTINTKPNSISPKTLTSKSTQSQGVSTLKPINTDSNARLGIPIKTASSNSATRAAIHPIYNRHPAPLPASPNPKIQNPNWKLVPPRPELKISKVNTGIVISWIMENYLDSRYEDIASYQIYAYQQTLSPPQTELWKKIGDVKALPLPMACTLTQFMTGYKYYFAVRAVDVRQRFGQFSVPAFILLTDDR